MDSICYPVFYLVFFNRIYAIQILKKLNTCVSVINDHTSNQINYYQTPQIDMIFYQQMERRSIKIKFFLLISFLSLLHSTKASQLALSGSLDLFSHLSEEVDDSRIYRVPQLAFHEGEVVLNAKRLSFQAPQSQTPYILSWEVTFRKALKAIRMIFGKPLQENVWSLKISYIIISPKGMQEIFHIFTMDLSSNKTLLKQLNLQGKEQNLNDNQIQYSDQTKNPYIFLRGYQLESSTFNKEALNIKMEIGFNAQEKLDIKISTSFVTKYFVTIMLVDESILKKVGYKFINCIQVNIQPNTIQVENSLSYLFSLNKQSGQNILEEQHIGLNPMCLSQYKSIKNLRKGQNILKIKKEVQFQQARLLHKICDNFITDYLSGCSCKGLLSKNHGDSCAFDHDCTCLIEKCDSGYYKKSKLATSCIKCPTTLLRCKKCGLQPGSSSKIICYQCEKGFAAFNGACVACPSGCSECEYKVVDNVIVQTCQQCICGLKKEKSGGIYKCSCPSNQFIVTTTDPVTCAGCPSICSTCISASSCTSCIAGYFIDTSSCILCMPVCKTCSSATTCDTCLSSTFNKVASVCECPPELFFDKDTKKCESCSDLTSSDCLQCKYQTLYDPGSPPDVICQLPQLGFYVSLGIAQPCIDHCSTCGSNTGCSQCDQNFYFQSGSCICMANFYFTAEGTCLSCESALQGCTACQDNTPAIATCTTCNSIGYYPLAGKCEKCPPLCSQCTGPNACTHCKLSPSNLIINNGVCVCNFNSGSDLFLNSLTNQCQSCSSAIPNCDTCSVVAGAVICSACSAQYYKSTDFKHCVSCPPTCSSCHNSSYCDYCEDGYDKINDMCVCGTTCEDCQASSTSGLCAFCTLPPSFTCNKCSSGYILNGVTCQSCSTKYYSQCQQCTLLKCTSCISPLFMSLHGCICDATQDQYRKPGTTSCVSCSSAITKCSKCYVELGITKCSECQPGYLQSALKDSCLKCQDRCSQCSGTVNDCDQCLSPFHHVLPNMCSCNNGVGLYYNKVTQGCSLCGDLIKGCIDCTQDLSQNVICSDCGAGYYPNSDQCVKCSQQCQQCSSSAVCDSCPTGFSVSQDVGWNVVGKCICNNNTIPALFFDQETSTCQQCSFVHPGCQDCQASGGLLNTICTDCIDSTYLDDNICKPCPSTCATCNQNSCLSCPPSLTLNSLGSCICQAQCTKCQFLSLGCTSCSILGGVVDECYSCMPGTYLTTSTCTACPANCATCSGSLACLTCLPTFVLINNLCSCATTLDMFISSQGKCLDCASIHIGCSECLSQGGKTVCSQCDTGYFISGDSCLPCNPNCLSCQGSATLCIKCLPGQSIDAGNTCACTSDMCTSCKINSNNCVDCIYSPTGTFIACNTCQPKFYLNGAFCSSCPPECLTCGQNGQCLTCPQTFDRIDGGCQCNKQLELWLSAGKCQKCNYLYPNCQACEENATLVADVRCIRCQGGFYILNQTCTASVCGDGVVTSGQTCDDYNAISGDGCSSYCQIQQNFKCSLGNPSVCQINVNFNINFQKLETSLSICNRITISFSLQPVYESYQSADFSKMLGFISQQNIIYVGWRYSKGTVQYDFDYTKSSTQQIVSISFLPSQLGVQQTKKYPIFPVQFELRSDNNVAIVYYNSSDCQTKIFIAEVIQSLQYASYGLLIASALPGKIVGLEIFGVLQLAHMSAGNTDNVNTMLAPIMQMKGVQGFSFDLGQEEKHDRRLQTSFTPDRVKSIGYESNFLRNCNLMIIIVASIIIVSLILYLCTFCCKNCAPSLHSFSKRVIKQVLLTLILFNCLNFAYSAGIHFTYAPEDDSLYQLGTFAAVVAVVLPLVMALALVLASDEGFGEYKEKFKPGNLEKMYFFVTILYRTGIGLYISTMNDDSKSTLIVLALSIAFLLYNLVNLPFTKAYHNYRANICHISQFICLLVSMYYRNMLKYEHINESAASYTPAFVEISAICISFIVSLVVLIYEIYLFVKGCCSKQKDTKIIPSQNDSSHYKQNNLTESKIDDLNEFYVKDMDASEQK